MRALFPAALLLLCLPALAQDGGLLKKAREGASGMASPPAAPVPEPKSPTPLFRMSVASETRIVNNLSGCRRKDRKGLLGCTVPAFGVKSARGAWKQAPAPGGLVALWTEPSELVFSLAQTIYITFAYPEGSCGYAVTLRHERTHERDARALFETWSGRLAEELESAGRYEPRFPPEKDPVVLPPDQVEAYKTKAGEKLLAIARYRLQEAPDSLMAMIDHTAEFRDTYETYAHDDFLERQCNRR